MRFGPGICQCLWLLTGCSAPAARGQSAQLGDLLASPAQLRSGIEALEQRVYRGRPPVLRDDAATEDLLELGALYSQFGRFEPSNRVLEAVFGRYVEREEGPVLRLRTIGSALLESTVAAGVGEYQPAGYEKVFLHVIKARNFLLAGAPEDAAVEVRRAYLVQRALREQVAEEIEAVEQEKRRRMRGDDEFARFVRDLDWDGLERQARYDVPAAGSSAVAGRRENAYGMLLAGVVYLAVGEYDDARIEVERAQTVTGSRQVGALAEGLEDLAAGHPGGRLPNVLVFASMDSGPRREALDLRFLNPLSRTPAKISFPVYRRRPATVGSARLCGSGMEPVADVDRLAYTEYVERLPGELTKTVIRAFSHGAKDAYLRKKFGLAGQLLGSVSTELLEAADTRCWGSLPKTVWFGAAGVPDGESASVEALAPDGRVVFERRFPIVPDRLNVIQVFLSPCNTRAFQTALAVPRGGSEAVATRGPASGTAGAAWR